MAEKFSGAKVVSELALEMRRSITAVAGSRSWSETRERWLERAARKIGLTYRQTKALFYCEVHDPRASVVEKVRSAALKEARREAAALATRFETIAGAMHAADQDFYSADVVALSGIARALRGLDRSGNNGGGSV